MMKFSNSMSKDQLSTAQKWEDSQIYKTTITASDQRQILVFTNNQTIIKTMKNNLLIIYPKTILINR